MRKWILPLLTSLMLAGVVTYAQQTGGPGGGTSSAVYTITGTGVANGYQFTGGGLPANTGFYSDPSGNWYGAEWGGVQTMIWTSNKMRFPRTRGIQFTGTSDAFAAATGEYGMDDDGTHMEMGAGLGIQPAWRLYTVASGSLSGNYEALTIEGGAGTISLNAKNGGSGSANIDITLSPNGTGALRVTSPVKVSTTVVGSLPTCNSTNKGMHSFVTDSNSTTFHATVANGGANNVAVVCDGTNWYID